METKPIKLHLIENYLETVGQFVDIQKVDSPAFAVAYNDFKDNKLESQTKFIQLGTYQTACSVTEEQIKDLKEVWDIDVTEMVKNVLINENVMSINKSCMANIGKLAKDKEISEYTLYDRVFDKLYSFLNKVYPKKIKINNFETKLTRQYIKKLKVKSVTEILDAILYASAKIARDGNFGYGNFVVCGSAIEALLKQSAYYTYIAKNNDKDPYDKRGNGLIYPIGNIAGITIYVDPYMIQSDTRVFIGRKNNSSEPGLKLFLKDEDLSTKFIDDWKYSPRIITRIRYSLIPVGESCKDMYRMITFKYDNKKIKI